MKEQTESTDQGECRDDVDPGSNHSVNKEEYLNSDSEPDTEGKNEAEDDEDAVEERETGERPTITGNESPDANEPLTLNGKVLGGHMETYEGTKVIGAVATTKRQYCDYRGWDVPKGEDPDEEIMLVEYEVDPKSKPNHENHKGYISMSPKHVFDKAYHKIGSFKDRVVHERTELNKKVSKLNLFLEKPQPVDKVSDEQWDLLHLQLDSMKIYSRILTARLRTL